MLGKLDINRQGGPCLIPHTKSAPKCIRDLRVRPVTVKLRRNAYGSKFGTDFLNMTSKALATKAKIDKWDCIKLENGLTAKETINGVKPIN